jgi:leader peptidase (prepilin peptidase)/N-methyltransferase
MSCILGGFALVLGAVVGSFLNVVIHRYPLEESVVFPPSRCPSCRTPIRWYDNIPVLSYLILRGRCRTCGAEISLRYPMVELANALFYLAIYLHAGPTIGFLLVAAVVSMMIALIYIDLDIQILPDVIDLPGVLVGLTIGALHLGSMTPGLVLADSLLDSAAGAAGGAVILLSIASAYRLIRKVEGMGLGDVKMIAMIGAVLGWRSLFPVLLLASIIGSSAGLIAAARSSRGLLVAVPFGVFLGLATLTVLFFGPYLWAWYLTTVVR